MFPIFSRAITANKTAATDDISVITYSSPAERQAGQNMSTRPRGSALQLCPEQTFVEHDYFQTGPPVIHSMVF